MQKKRTASLPIFNRGKRPRQALLTHPNNVDGASLEQQQRQDGCWNSKSYGHAQAQHRDGPPRYANSAQKPLTNMPTSTPMSGRRGGYNQSQLNKENVHSAPKFKPFRSNCSTDHPAPGIGRNTNTYSSRGSNHVANTGAPKQPPVRQTNTTRSFSPAKPVPGKAMEPAQNYGAKLEPSPHPTNMSLQMLSHFPRILTATAKGMEHWSKYKAQMAMLFEVFGTLNSAVMAGPLNSREFSLQTPDGAVRCLYWEVDTTLPHLVRGKPLRVVGSWEEGQQWVKCHSVREASQQEMQCAHHMVAGCDGAMREAVSRLPEM